MARSGFSPPNTGFRQLGAALPERGVGGAVKASVQGAVAGDRQQRANQATDELNEFLQNNPNSQLEVAEKAVEIGQKYNLPELAKRGQQQLQSLQSGQAVQQNEIQLEQARQDQAVQLARGGFFANYAEAQQKNPGNPMRAFTEAYEQTTKQAGSLGVSNPDSVVGRAVQPMLAKMMQAQGDGGTEIRAVRNGQIIGTRGGELFQQPVQGTGGESSGPPGGGPPDPARNSILPPRVRNMADEEGNLLPNSENLTDVSSVPFSGGDVKSHFEQRVGIRLSDTEFDQLQNLAQRPEMSQLDALERVLQDNRSPEQLQQLQQNATTGGPRPSRPSPDQVQDEPEESTDREITNADLRAFRQRIQQRIQNGEITPQQALEFIRNLDQLSEEDKRRLINGTPILQESQPDEPAGIQPAASTDSDVAATGPPVGP